MNQKPVINLQVPKSTFLLINNFLMMVKLGDTSVFETDISNLMADWEDPGVQELLSNISREFGEPEIVVRASETSGVTFEVEVE